MPEIHKVAIIGEEDLLRPFRVLGFEVFDAKTAEEAREALKVVEREGFGLCLLPQSLLEPLEEERRALAGKFIPVLLAFADYRQPFGRMEALLRTMAMKATGTDALAKRKG